MKLSETTQRQAQHIMIFGDPKSGKSMLAATVAAIPEVKKVIWFSLDNGHGILYKLGVAEQDKIELVVLPDTSGFPVALSTLIRVVTGASCNICDAHGQIDCSSCRKDKYAAWTLINLKAEPISTVVVIDHLSQLAESSMNLINKDRKDDYFPGWDEFRLQGIIMSRVIGYIQQASYNIICIAHSCETEMEDGTKKLVPLVGTVPFSRNVGKAFDHLIYMRVANKKHAAGSSTTYLPGVLTGSRGSAEDDKKFSETLSLAPFFQGKIPTAAQQDAEGALAYLNSLAPQLVQKPVSQLDTVPVPPAVDNTILPTTAGPAKEAEPVLSASEAAKKRLAAMRGQ